MSVYRSAIVLTIALCAASIGFPADAAPKTKDKTPFNVKNLGVVLDTKGFAKKMKTNVVPRKAHDKEDQVNWMNGEPEFLHITFDNEKADTWNYKQRQLLVYPVQTYLALYEADGKKEFNGWMATMKKIIANKNADGVEEIPVLPSGDGHQVFRAQKKFVKFKQGSGIRFVSQYSNGDPPLSNKDMFYTFQGLTNDNRYYISFFHPLNIKDLPENISAEKSEEYANKVEQKRFSPTLDSLDRVIESLNLTEDKPKGVADLGGARKTPLVADGRDK